MTRKNYQRHRLFRVSLRQQPSLLSGSGDEKLYTELVSGSELNTGVGFGVMIMSSAKNDVQGKVGIHVSTDMGSSTEETWTTTATTAVNVVSGQAKRNDSQCGLPVVSGQAKKK